MPHKSPDFDALIRLESVNVSTRLYRVEVPTEMNGSPFFSIYLKYWGLDDEEDESPSALEVELEIENNGLVGDFFVPVETALSRPYLEVYYQGSDDPCGTIAIKAIAGVE